MKSLWRTPSYPTNQPLRPDASILSISTPRVRVGWDPTILALNRRRRSRKGLGAVHGKPIGREIAMSSLSNCEST